VQLSLIKLKGNIKKRPRKRSYLLWNPFVSLLLDRAAAVAWLWLLRILPWQPCLALATLVVSLC